MKELIGLDMLCVGELAIIRQIDHCTGMRRRLLDLGFTEGTRVSCVGISPQGSMKAYSVRGSVIALRLCDACHIKVLSYGGCYET